MAITRSTAIQLLTKAEFKLWMAAQRSEVNNLTSLALRKKIVMTRRARDKFRDLAKRQKALGKRTKGTSDVAKRTEKKHQIFTDILRVFERALAAKEAQEKRLSRSKKAQEKASRSGKSTKATRAESDVESTLSTAAPALSYALKVKKQALAKKAKGGASKLSLQKGVARKSAAKRVSSHTRASNARKQARRDSR